MLAHTLYSELLRRYKSPLELYRQTGILIPIAGGGPVSTKEGYNEASEILTRTIDQVPLEELYNELIATTNYINSFRDPLISRLTFTVEEPFEEIMQAISADFEEADEFGQPVGIRLGGPWNMGFPIHYFDLGLRYTFRFLGRATAAQIRALHNQALQADNRLIYKTVLTRLFDNTNEAATLEQSGTAVTVFPFYNGDVTALPVAPPTWKSYSFATSHTHYLASGAATLNSADLDTDMYDHIYHHGYVEGSELILLVNRAEGKVIRKFRVTSGDMYDFIPAAPRASANWSGASFYGELYGGLASPPPGGDGLDAFPGFIGWYGPWNVIEEDMIPAGYLVGLAAGGPRDPGNPVGLREHENPELRGLKVIPQFERYPLREAFYHHALGAGIRYPGKGVVMRVGTAAYSIPTLVFGGSGGR